MKLVSPLSKKTDEGKPQRMQTYRVVFALIFVFSLFTALSGRALAYSTEGGRWYGGGNISINFQSFAQGYNRQGFIDGYNAWNRTNSHVHFSENGGSLTVHDVDRSDVKGTPLTILIHSDISLPPMHGSIPTSPVDITEPQYKK